MSLDPSNTVCSLNDTVDHVPIHSNGCDVSVEPHGKVGCRGIGVSGCGWMFRE